MIRARNHSRRLLQTVALAVLAACVIPGGFTASARANGVSYPCEAGGPFAGGDGSEADPYLISNEAQLAAIDTPGTEYIFCDFRQTQDIALTIAWSPIASGTSDGTRYRTFRGEYDGGGKKISGLNVTPSFSAPGGQFTGLFGNTYGATIRDLFISGVVNTPTLRAAGGLVGQADTGTTITNVHADVSVTGDSLVGGLVGWGPETTIVNSSASGNVRGTGRSGEVGGLIGEALGRSSYLPPFRTTITDSYATGSVTGLPVAAGLGGLVGLMTENDVRIIRSYSTGAVTGGYTSETICDDPGDPDTCTTYNGTTGGLIAPSSPSGTYTGLIVTDSFWDSQTTGLATSANDLGSGKTTAEMKKAATFSAASWDIADGWDPAKTWGICEGTTYPFLTGQYRASPCAGPTPAPDPGPTPGPGPSPSPSNAFTMYKPRAIRSTVASVVTVPGPGVLKMKGARSHNAASHLTACRGSKAVDRAGSVLVTCKANAATRAAQRRGSVRLIITVTYTPTRGTPRTSRPRTVLLRSLKPAYAG